MSSSIHPGIAGRSAVLETARGAVRLGRLREAETAYEQLIEEPSAAREALTFLAAMAFQRRDLSRAVELLERAVVLAPDHPDSLTSLGVAYEAQGLLDEAARVYEHTAKVEPAYFVARLRLGRLLERQGLSRRALPHYFAAIVFANEKGQWTAANPPGPGLRADVQKAEAAVTAGRRALFHESLAPVRARYGAESIGRVEKALATYLGESAPEIPDPRQRPHFMFVPGLPSQPYFSREQTPFLEQLEAGYSTIRGEAEEVVASGALPSFFETDDSAFIETHISGERGTPSWDALHFYKFGRRYDQNHARAPRTSSIIEALPLVRISNHSPEICFSLLTPGTVIRPHSGVSNCRVVVHLPLVVPENCALRVGGEVHVWKEGRCIAFDDTFEHEAWNKSEDQIRIILLMDAWNPHLTEAERMALNDLIVGIGDFNAEVRGQR